MKTRVLIAERDASLRDAYRLFLEGCGYEMDEACNGLECMEKLIDSPPAFLVLECGLHWGGADGVIARMREDWDVPSLPVVLIAGDGSCEELSELVADPVIDCWRKPFPMNALLRCLQSTEHGGRQAITK
jgi:DNA-binding NtrC family response regulator